MLLAFITLMGVSFYGASLHAQNPKDTAIKFDFDLNVIPNSRNLPDSVVGKLRITNFDAGSRPGFGAQKAGDVPATAAATGQIPAPRRQSAP